MLYAAAKNNTEMVRLLLDKGAKVSKKNKVINSSLPSNWTMMIIASGEAFHHRYLPQN